MKAAEKKKTTKTYHPKHLKYEERKKKKESVCVPYLGLSVALDNMYIHNQ